MKILLAEDDFVTRKFMASFLSKYGECDVTVDGMEAVDAFMLALEEGEPYDLVCLDIMMPVMDGITAAGKIRSSGRPDSADIPIIAMTANAFAEDAKKCMEAGMNANLAKPLDVKKLMSTIARLSASSSGSVKTDENN